MEAFWNECDPNKENLCLYGNPDGTWKVGCVLEARQRGAGRESGSMCLDMS